VSKRRIGEALAAAIATTVCGLFVCSAALAQPADLLNSQRIEQTFGSYGIAVLESAAGIRVSNLYSTNGTRDVCRTFAVVRYPPIVEPAFAAEHAAILAGGSIGAAFAAAGWDVAKLHGYYGEVKAQGRAAELMSVQAGTRLAAHVYALDVIKDGARFRYATMVEIHHPEYLTVDDLRTIYGPLSENAADTADILALAAAKMR
jgi:hypothetical protein